MTYIEQQLENYKSDKIKPISEYTGIYFRNHFSWAFSICECIKATTLARKNNLTLFVNRSNKYLWKNFKIKDYSFFDYFDINYHNVEYIDDPEAKVNESWLESVRYPFIVIPFDILTSQYGDILSLKDTFKSIQNYYETLKEYNIQERIGLPLRLTKPYSGFTNEQQDQRETSLSTILEFKKKYPNSSTKILVANDDPELYTKWGYDILLKNQYDDILVLSDIHNTTKDNNINDDITSSNREDNLKVAYVMGKCKEYFTMYEANENESGSFTALVIPYLQFLESKFRY